MAVCTKHQIGRQPCCDFGSKGSMIHLRLTQSSRPETGAEQMETHLGTRMEFCNAENAESKASAGHTFAQLPLVGQRCLSGVCVGSMPTMQAMRCTNTATGIVLIRNYTKKPQHLIHASKVKKAITETEQGGTETAKPVAELAECSGSCRGGRSCRHS